MRSKIAAFTLIELLVVITIIALLMGLILSVGSEMQEKAKKANTRGTVLTLATACEQYKAIYYLYPDLDRAPKTLNTTTLLFTAFETPISGTFSETNCLEFNRRLRNVLEEFVYRVDEVRHGPFIEQKLPKDDDGLRYIDGWGEPLLVWWGRDHSAAGNDPIGPNYYDTVRRFTYPLDIWSKATNATDDSSLTGAEATATSLDATDSNKDDIVSWQSKTK